MGRVVRPTIVWEVIVGFQSGLNKKLDLYLFRAIYDVQTAKVTICCKPTDFGNPQLVARTVMGADIMLVKIALAEFFLERQLSIFLALAPGSQN